MLNKEKYKEKIEQILVDGEVLAFDKKNNEIIPCCFYTTVAIVNFYFPMVKSVRKIVENGSTVSTLIQR